jgi:hypothetical protein
MSNASAFSGLEQVVQQTTHDAQWLIDKLHVADGGLCISFNNGNPSPLAVDIRRRASAHSPQQRTQQDALTALTGPEVAARHMLSIDELFEFLTADLVALSQLCRISVGNYRFGLGFSQAGFTARNGAIRDLVVSRRFMLEEIPCLKAIAKVLRELARAYPSYDKDMRNPRRVL